jgi:hypothetical protein
MKASILKAAGVVTGFIVLVAVGILLLYASPLSYLYCLSRENSWLKATDEKELEHRLIAFYSKSAITPEKSSWGRDHVLRDGQRMTQYLIFGKEPLDVVYNADGTVDTIYTSYE